MNRDLGWVPDACTLPSAEQPLRVTEFDAAFAEHVLDVTRPHPTHLVVRLRRSDGVAARVADLADRESACCGFFGFRLTVADPLVLEVSVDADHVAVLDGLEERARLAVR